MVEWHWLCLKVSYSEKTSQKHVNICWIIANFKALYLYRKVYFLEVENAHFDLMKHGSEAVFVSAYSGGCTRLDLFPVNADGCTLVVELKDGPQVRFVALDTPRFFAETTSVSELPRLLPEAASRDFYRITLLGEDSQPSLSELCRQYSHLPHLELRDLRTAPARLWGSINSDTLEGLYFRHLKDAFDKADTETGQIIRLAAMLSQQILDGQEVILP